MLDNNIEKSSCPTCSTPLKKAEFDNQPILHCSRCGGTFFEQNGINRISVTNAGKLANDHSEKITPPLELACPKDQSVMIRLADEEAIPLDVEIFRCPSCYGLFAPPEDLKKFKKAQRAKIQFFKIWGKPMPSPRAVLAFSFIGLVALSLAFSLIMKSVRFSRSTLADQNIRNTYVKRDEKIAFVSFITSADYRSNIVLRNLKTGEKKTIVVSKDPTQVHVATLMDLNKADKYYYQVILLDQKGEEIKSSEMELK